MTLRRVETVKHEGRIDPDEQFTVIMTTRHLVVKPARVQGDKKYVIPEKHWPKAVRDSVSRVQARLASLGRPHEASAFIAWIEAPNIDDHVDVCISLKDKNGKYETVPLTGTVTDFLGLDEPPG